MPLYFFIILIIALLLVAVLLKHGGNTSTFESSQSDFDYKDHLVKKNLLSDNEKEFYNRLLKSKPQSWHILSQVAMAAILISKSGLGRKTTNSIRYRFNRKIIDFAVFDKDFNLLFVIELDDKTHNKERDAERDAMLLAAGIKTVRFESKNKPNVEMLTQLFQKLSPPV